MNEQEIAQIISQEIERHEKSFLREKSEETLHMYLFELIKEQSVRLTYGFLQVCLLYVQFHIVGSIVAVTCVGIASILVFELRKHWQHILDYIAQIVNIDWRI